MISPSCSSWLAKTPAQPASWSKYLDSVPDHKVRHRPTSNLPFHLIVLLLGGIMNGGRTKVFASWKRVMTRGIYNLMLKRLSLCLLQARARSFELQGFIPP
jgi:hypothetical protein